MVTLNEKIYSVVKHYEEKARADFKRFISGLHATAYTKEIDLVESASILTYVTDRYNIDFTTIVRNVNVLTNPIPALPGYEQIASHIELRGDIFAKLNESSKIRIELHIPPLKIKANIYRHINSNDLKMFYFFENDPYELDKNFGDIIQHKIAEMIYQAEEIL